MASPSDPPPQKVSLSLNRLKKPAAASHATATTTNTLKRPRDALRDNEDGDNEDAEEQQRATKVSHFDLKAGGALDESNREAKKAPLVIARQANRDWKDAANSKRKRQRGGIPWGRSEEGGREERDGGTTEPSKIFGVNLASSRRDDGDATANAPLEGSEKTQEAPLEPSAEVSVAAAPKTEDEEAMDALLGRTKKSELVVPALTEEDAFQNDITEAPDMATLEDYARVPVEQFGAAMLRGMGWKDGDGIGLNKGSKQVKAKVPERRPALLGIGAKEEAAVAQEMGTWGKAARGRGGKEPVVYNPILLRDKRTGEMFTEEEAKKREEKDERERYEMEFERKEQEKRGKDKDKGRESRRRRDDEDDERERRREKDRRRDRGDDRHRDHDRERRRRDDDGEEDEEERRRRKDKERRRREREDEEYDRERSKRHDRDRDGHRRRERSREHRRR